MFREGPQRVLVLAPTPGDASLTRSILADAGFEHYLCRDTAELAREIRNGAGAVLLTEDSLARDVRPLTRELTGQPGWSDIPTLLLAAPEASSEVDVVAKEVLGNVTVLERPVRVRTLVSALQAAIRARRRQYELRARLRELETAKEEVGRLNTELRAELRRMRRLHVLGTRLVQSTEMSELLVESLDAAIELSRADGMGNVQVVEDGVLRIVAHRGLSDRFVAFFDEVQPGTAACGTAFRRGERVIVEDVASSPIFAGQPAGDVLLDEGVRAVQSTPLVSRSGEIVGLLSTHYREAPRLSDADLRALDLLARQAADFIERARGEEALKEADRRKDAFLATLAHELRSPLAPIRNALEVIRLRQDDSQQVGRSRGMIERQLGQMVRLIDDLLDVNRISRGKLELRTKRVRLADVIDSAVETTRASMEAADQRLFIELPDEPVHLEADRVRLAQVFANLLSNAAKYSEPGGRIWLHAERAEDGVSVTVRDEGRGIAAEDLTRVFEMFAQLDESPDIAGGGLGIGLTLVRQLTEQHGGSVEAHSEGPGKGSAFTVRLPVAGAAEAAQPAATAPEVPVHESGRRILIADDNEDTADSMEALLQLMGHDVRVARDGEAALAQAEDFRPDITLLDIGMPKIDGYGVARRIRERSWGRQTFLVAVTGWGQEQDKARALAAGFDHHFTKPLQPAALKELISRLQPESGPRE